MTIQQQQKQQQQLQVKEYQGRSRGGEKHLRYIPPLSHTKVHIVHNVSAKLADGGFDDTARASGLVSK
jgi:hypothetical protein